MANRFLGVSLLVVALSGCAAPVDTHGASEQVAGRCKLLAYKEDRHIAFGLLSMAIVQANANARRQEVYDSCVQAAGSRELTPEVAP
jgi:hypothetical protein